MNGSIWQITETREKEDLLMRKGKRQPNYSLGFVKLKKLFILLFGSSFPFGTDYS